MSVELLPIQLDGLAGPSLPDLGRFPGDRLTCTPSVASLEVLGVEQVIRLCYHRVHSVAASESQEQEGTGQSPFEELVGVEYLYQTRHNSE